jgi:hypothetical protein
MVFMNNCIFKIQINSVENTVIYFVKLLSRHIVSIVAIKLAENLIHINLPYFIFSKFLLELFQ